MGHLAIYGLGRFFIDQVEIFIAMVIENVQKYTIFDLCGLGSDIFCFNFNVNWIGFEFLSQTLLPSKTVP